MLRFAGALVVAVTFLCADTAPQLENSGKPMHVSFTCNQDDLRSLGLSCSEEEPCPIYLELSAVEAVGNRLFLAGNFHTATATISSILFESVDNGKTWNEPYDRVRFSELEQIQFVDTEHGWISGATIQTLPRDPFFLLTTDGGKTWRQREIFDEAHGGSIDRFWFDSPASGTLLLTPIGKTYELYATTNGGDSWILKQSAPKPLSLGHGQRAEATWRLRPDGHNHSYDIELKQGTGWQRIASFLVDVGVCK